MKLSDKEKVETFKSKVYNSDPLFYEFKFNQIGNDGNLDEKIIDVFNNFKSMRDRFISLHQNLKSKLKEGLSKLEKMFPDFIIDFPIHVCHSFGECDGCTRKLGEKEELILGIDTMAKVHNWDNEIPFIQHELFHVYHDQIYKPLNLNDYDEEALYNAIWSEGLATYISHILNPDASVKELLLDIPKNLVKDTEKHIKEVSSEILENLYSKDSDIYSKFFLFKGEHKLPKRSGYYISFLIVKEIAKHRSLNDLILLKESQFLPYFVKILKKMAKNELEIKFIDLKLD